MQNNNEVKTHMLNQSHISYTDSFPKFQPFLQFRQNFFPLSTLVYCPSYRLHIDLDVIKLEEIVVAVYNFIEFLVVDITTFV